MDSSALIDTLHQAIPAAQVEPASSIDLQTTVYLSRDAIGAAARVLRDRADLAFTFLAELTAVDLWPREPRYEVVYVLVSITNRLRLRLKNPMETW